MSALTSAIGRPARLASRTWAWARPITDASSPVLRKLAGSAPAVAVRAGFGAVFGTVTALGWGLLIAAAASAVAAEALGWRELLVAALLCGAVVVAAIPFALGRAAYGIRLDLTRDRVVVGEPAVGAVEVRNSARRLALPAQIELPVGTAFASFRVPRLAPGEAHEELFTIPTERRAVLAVGPVRSARGDSLGVLSRRVRWTQPAELFVHPTTVALDGSSAGILRDLEGLPTRELSSSDVSFHALREYVSGDDRRHVHWKTSARMNHLMVRQFEETRRSHLAIALSGADVDYESAEQYELAVSAVGSLGLQAIKEDKGVSVHTHGAALRTATARRLLDDLSGVERAAVGTGIAALARSVGLAVPQASVVIMVIGGVVTAQQLRAATMHVPHGVRVIAVRCVPGAAVSRRLLGELVVLTIGELRELPRAMRSVA